MNDLISRKDALNEVDILEFYFSHHDVITKFCEKLKIGIEKRPAVDAVEVVRCKNCRRFKPHEERPEFGFCKLYPLGLAKYENGFCEHGERKENEGNS